MPNKNAERMKRGMGNGISFKSLSAGHSVKQWRRFLTDPENKSNLIAFIVDEWQTDNVKSIIASKQIFVTCGHICWNICSNGSTTVESLRSTQEEADTRMILHVKHASEKGFKTVIVVSEDTDVFILCAAFAKKINASIFQKERDKEQGAIY